MSHPLSHPVTVAFAECVALTLLAMIHGTLAVAQAISDSDWSRLTGQHGAVFVLAVVGLAFWGKAVKDDKNRERRHTENLTASERHFERLITLQDCHAVELRKLTEDSLAALNSNAVATDKLAKELAGRPCRFPLGSSTKLPSITPE